MSAPLWVVLLASLVLFGACVAAMAIGVMFKRPCLRGSCGGPALQTPSGEKISCATCPNRRWATAPADMRGDDEDPA